MSYLIFCVDNLAGFKICEETTVQFYLSANLGRTYVISVDEYNIGCRFAYYRRKMLAMKHCLIGNSGRNVEAIDPMQWVNNNNR